MLISAGMVAFVILGMFFSMLTSSPKTEAEVKVTDGRDRLTQ
jgi:hypothetical protein